MWGDRRKEPKLRSLGPVRESLQRQSCSKWCASSSAYSEGGLAEQVGEQSDAAGREPDVAQSVALPRGRSIEASKPSKRHLSIALDSGSMVYALFPLWLPSAQAEV